jgi:hypothetical protein
MPEEYRKVYPDGYRLERPGIRQEVNPESESGVVSQRLREELNRK